MTLLALLRQNLGHPRHRQLLAVAARLRDDGEFDYAVVAAQTACELYAELAIDRMLTATQLGPFTDLLLSPVTGYSLRHERQGLDLFRVLSGCDPPHDDPQLWERYCKHVQRRHNVVHKGHQATSQEADESIEVAEQWFDYIASATDAGMARKGLSSST